MPSRHPPRPKRLDRLHHAAQFGQALEAADEGIAGVRRASAGRRREGGRGRGASGFRRRRGLRRGGARSSPISSATSATRSASPPRWSASKNEPSGSRLTLRRWTKWMRGPNSRAMATRSFAGFEPNEPAQSVRPQACDGTAANSLRTSSAVESTRGRPKIGKAGSSGWMASRAPSSSATSVISRDEGDQVCAHRLRRRRRRSAASIGAEARRGRRRNRAPAASRSASRSSASFASGVIASKRALAAAIRSGG